MPLRSAPVYKTMKLLLHTCCAPCSTAVIEALGQEKLHDEYKPALFWYNPNIHPYTEYRSRRDSLIAFSRDEELELITEDEYGLRGFIRGLQCTNNAYFINNERCEFCYQFRLERTARLGAEKGFDAFSTTLLTSPYQKHESICQIGEQLALRYKVDFFYRDFRPWFRTGRQKARARGAYMQKYCGCIFSEEERYLQ
jgi:predicted adenine nucleotide alpha hydrolase (AANH) superfamily ATPase